MATIDGIHHIGFTVTDLDRSVAWYTQVLGFEVLRRFEGNGLKRTLLRHSGAGLSIGLALHPMGPDDPFDEERTGLDHIAFSVSGRAELEEWLERFEQHGVDHSPIKEGVTGWLITFRDPDNIQLEVYSRTK